MNEFAETIFAFILGFFKNITASIMQFLSSNKSLDTIHLIANNWLYIVLFLALVGMSIDFIVWFIRWKPYEFWLLKLQKKGKYHLKNRAFEEGYDDQISLYKDENKRFFKKQHTGKIEKEQASYMPAFDETHLFEQHPVSPVQAPPSKDQKTDFLNSYALLPATRTKRRSEKHKKGLKGAINMVKGHLKNEDADDEKLMQGLPPIMQKDEAFYKPVYPKVFQDKRRE